MTALTMRSDEKFLNGGKSPSSVFPQRLAFSLFQVPTVEFRRVNNIDGARQTGSPYLLKELFGAQFNQVVVLDFLENPNLADIFAESKTPERRRFTQVLWRESPGNVCVCFRF